MNRKQLIDFVNSDILPQIDSSFTWRDILPAKEIIKLVIDYRRDQIKAGSASVEDGFLYINHTPIKRITPKLPKMPYDEQSYYIEGRILAAGEID